MRNFILLLTSAFFLTACVITVPPETAETIAVPLEKVVISERFATAEQRASCESQGGIIEQAGMRGFERCTYPYADAGKVCTDGAQCEGECRTDITLSVTEQTAQTSGQCQIDDNPFGCFGRVNQGQVRGVLCVD